MSDETFSITAPFPDVASLAQGYVNRADGERLLLPLPQVFATGAVVRFMVHLVDGTPAFAGIGMCVQSSDQGPAIEPEHRFETLLDSLRFDARSQPVYDYIVAVRASMYAQAPAAAELMAADPSDAPAADVDVDATAVHDLFAQQRHEFAQQRQETVRPDGGAESAFRSERTGTHEAAPDGESGHFSRPPMDNGGVVSRDPSFVPPPIPTGLLRRPARTMHWQPAPPRRPTPRPASGLFRYGLAGLPRPSRPPRPEIEPSAWVSRAPKP